MFNLLTVMIHLLSVSHCLCESDNCSLSSALDSSCADSDIVSSVVSQSQKRTGPTDHGPTVANAEACKLEHCSREMVSTGGYMSDQPHDNQTDWFKLSFQYLRPHVCLTQSVWSS